MVDKSRPLPFPRVRRGLIVASFILFIIWIAVFVFYTYRDPEILCGANNTINIFTFIIIGTSLFGVVVYLFSPDSQLKIKSWVRRIPKFWNYLMDSSYTPYFDPDYFILKNGRYLQITNNMLKSDNMGLPIVDALTPLNSFNMDIYRKYNKTILDKTTQWVNTNSPSPLNNRHILNKFILERSRIVVVGDTCMIVKSWSGEHLLIHKSKYEDFIEDQRKTTRMLEIDILRDYDLTTQSDRIIGLKYLAETLNGENSDDQNMSQKALQSHYKPLINEMAALYSCYPNIAQEISNVIRNVLDDDSVSYSFRAVLRKFMDLSLANIVKFNFNHKKVQTELLVANNNTESVLEGIFITQMNGSKYQSLIANQIRYQSDISGKLIQVLDNPAIMHNVFKNISPSCVFDTNIKIIPRYAPYNLRPSIKAYVLTYNQKHNIKAYVTDHLFKKKSGPSDDEIPIATISGPVLEEAIELPERPLDPNMTKLVTVSTDSSISDNIDYTSTLALTADNFAKLELAKAEQTEIAINEMLATMRQQLEALEKSVKEIPNNTQLARLLNEHKSNTEQVEEKAQLITDQRIELQMAMRDNARISEDAAKQLKELNNLKQEAREKTAMFQANEKQVRELEMKLYKRDAEFEEYKKQLEDIQQKQTNVIEQYNIRQSEYSSAYQNQIDELNRRQREKEKELENLHKIQKISDSRYAEEQKKLNEYYKKQNDDANKLYNDYIARQEQIHNSQITQMGDNQKKLLSSIAQISQDKEKLVGEFKSKSDALEQTTRKLDQLTQEFRQMDMKSKEILADVADKAAQLETFERKNKDILSQKMIQKLQHIVANKNLTNNLEQYKKQIDQKMNELQDAKKAINESRAKEQNLAAYLDIVRQKKAETMLRNAVIRKHAEKQNAEKNAILKNLSATNKEIAKRYDEFSFNLNQKQVENEYLASQLQREQQRITALQLSKAALESENDAERSKSEQFIREAQESAQLQVDAIKNQIEAKDAEIETLRQTLETTKENLQRQSAAVAAAKLEEVSQSNLEVLRLQRQLDMAAEQEQIYLKDKAITEMEKQAIINEKNELAKLKKELESQMAKEIQTIADQYKREMSQTKAKAEKYKQQLGEQMEQSQITSQSLSSVLQSVTSITLDNLEGNKSIVVNDNLIINLIDQMNNYLTDSTSNSKPIEASAKEFYPVGSPQAEIEGKILNYVYSLWILINKHPQISSALQSINENPGLERSRFIENCNKFIELGTKIFVKSKKLETIVSMRNISYLANTREEDIKNFLDSNRIIKLSPTPPQTTKQRNSPKVQKNELPIKAPSDKIQLTPENAKSIFGVNKLDGIVLKNDPENIAIIKKLSSVHPQIKEPLGKLIQTLTQNNQSINTIANTLNDLIEVINSNLIRTGEFLNYYNIPEPRNAW